MKYIKHIVGEYNESTLMQSCIICGELITDNRNCAWPTGQEPPKGFNEGEVYISNSNFPKIFLASKPEDEIVENCKSN